MKKKYENPIAEIRYFLCEDVLTASRQDVDDFDFIDANEILR